MDQPTTARRGRGVPDDVAPFILAAAKDLARPRGDVREADVDVSHLPGDASLSAGMTNLVGWMRQGIVHVRAQADRRGPVYRHRIGPNLSVWVTDPAAVAAIARNEQGVWSAPLGWRRFFEGITTRETMDSPVGFDFETHRDARRVLAPAFGAKALEGYVRLARETIEPAVMTWRRDGRSSFKRDVRRLFAGVAARIFMGVDDPREAELLDNAMADFWSAPSALAKSTWISPKWRRAVRGWDLLARTFRARVAARRAGEGDDLFSRMCREEHGLAWLDDETLVGLFLGVMTAAFDTTSMGITSMGYLLATHPSWQDRLREEGRGIDPEAIVREETKRLVLHEWAWKETLRLMPVATSLPRRPLRDVEVAGHRIPAGAHVMAVFAAAQHDPAIFPRPRVFDPLRFSPERAEDKRAKGAFMPFGAGAHTCIGAQLSSLEATVFWHALLQRARIRLARPYTSRHTLSPLGVVSGDVELAVEPL